MAAAEAIMSKLGEIGGISVVIPAYNYAKFLPQAVDSVLAQNWPAAEIIVVDDGSTDETPEVARRYGQRIRYIRQENAGLSAARNTGIQAATQTFVAFLDADDIWRPNLLEQAMRAFKSLPESFGIVACQSERIDEAGRPLPAVRGVADIDGEVTAADILLKSRFSPSSVVARRVCFETAGLFDTSLRSSEDRDMWIRIGTHWRIWVEAGRCLLLRKHGLNMSGHAERMKINMGRVIRKAWSARVVSPARFWFWLQVLSIYRFQTAVMFAGVNRPGQAFKDILESLLLWPLPHSARRIGTNVHAIRWRTFAGISKQALVGGREAK